MPIATNFISLSEFLKSLSKKEKKIIIKWKETPIFYILVIIDHFGLGLTFQFVHTKKMVNTNIIMKIRPTENKNWMWTNRPNTHTHTQKEESEPGSKTDRTQS